MVEKQGQLDITIVADSFPELGQTYPEYISSLQ